MHKSVKNGSGGTHLVMASAAVGLVLAVGAAACGSDDVAGVDNGASSGGATSSSGGATSSGGSSSSSSGAGASSSSGAASSSSGGASDGGSSSSGGSSSGGSSGGATVTACEFDFATLATKFQEIRVGAPCDGTCDPLTKCCVDSSVLGGGLGGFDAGGLLGDGGLGFPSEACIDK